VQAAKETADLLARLIADEEASIQLYEDWLAAGQPASAIKERLGDCVILKPKDQWTL
jgi:hypothetical protein